MKILHIGPIKSSRGLTGPSNSVRGLAAAQAGIGLEVGLLNSLPLEPNAQVETVAGVRMIQGPHKAHTNPWWISEDWISRIKTEFGTPDVVNFHSFYEPFQCALAKRCRQYGWPYIITPRGELMMEAQRVKHLKKAIANFLSFNLYLRNAAAVHALCPREADQARSLFEIKRIITIPNGVEDSIFDASNRLTAADLGDFKRDCDLMLGFVGRIDVHHKGFDLLLQALAILKSQPEGPNCRLFVVGSFRKQKDERFFARALPSLGLKQEVLLLGPKYGEDKLRYLMACDVFVHTSRFEGMPNAVLEAMALARPCLVTPGSNMADVVNEAGGWVTEAEPGAIAESIRRILESRSSLSVIGRNFQNLAHSRFNWFKIAKELKEEYIAICEQNT